LRVVEDIVVLLTVVEFPFTTTLVVAGLVEVAGLLTWGVLLGVALGVLLWCGAEWLGLVRGCDACGLDAARATTRFGSSAST